MLIFLYGQDSFRSRQKLEEMINNYKEVHKKGLSLISLDGENLDFADLANELKTTSMFKEKKLLIIRNVFTNKKLKEDFLKNAGQLADSGDLVLFYEGADVDKREGLFKFLLKKAKAQEFLFLDGVKLETWLKNYLLDQKVLTDAQALKKLIFYVGSDLWQMKNEVAKLKNYAKDRKILPEDVDLLVRPKIENDIFETIDSLAQKRKDKALYLIHKHLEKGESPLYLLSMITFQFRNLLTVKDLAERGVLPYDIAKRSGLHPFVAKKTYWQAEKFRLPQLKKIYHQIFQIDLSIKTGKMDPETALDVLVASL
jgi:DNA polymerase III subunit delta